MGTPSNKLMIGSGVARGANAFVQNFYAARNMVFQKKQQQNQVAIAALLSQLNDENTPLNKHGEIVDEIQRLANGGKPVKDDERLSKHLGLTPDSPLMNQQVDTGEVKKQTIGGGSDVLNPSITNPTDVSQVNQSMGSPPEMTANLPITKKRGELTPFDLKLIQQRFGQKSEEERQLRIAQANADIQERSYKRLGFEVIDRGKDSQGNNYLVSQNKAGETKIKNLNTNKEVDSLPQDFVSEKENLAKLRGNNLPTSIKAWEEYYLNQINPETNQPNTPQEAHILAVNKYAEIGQSQIQGNQARTLSTEQSTGQAQPSPKMRSEEDTKKETEVNNILGKHRSAYADYMEVTTLLPAIDQQANEAKQNRDAAQTAYDKYVKSEDYDAEDKDQLAEANRLQENIYKYNKDYVSLQEKHDVLVAKGTRAKNEMKSIANEAKSSRYANEFNVTQGSLWQGQRDVWMIERNKFGTQSDNSTPSQQNVNPISAIVTRPEVRTKIDNYRKANPKVQMTDEEWYQWLVDNKKIIPPK